MSVTTASHWWGETATKVVVALMCAAGIALGGWMLTMYTQLITLNVKLDTINLTINETKDRSAKSQALAEDNSRRIQRVEDTRYTREDAQECQRKMEALDNRIARLESNKRR